MQRKTQMQNTNANVNANTKCKCEHECKHECECKHKCKHQHERDHDHDHKCEREPKCEDRWKGEAEEIGKTIAGSDECLQVGPAMALLEDLQRDTIPLEAPCTVVDNRLDILKDRPRLCT